MLRKDTKPIRRKFDLFNEMWSLNCQRRSGK